MKLHYRSLPVSRQFRIDSSQFHRLRKAGFVFPLFLDRDKRELPLSRRLLLRLSASDGLAIR
jgi:hypothetical protein